MYDFPVMEKDASYCANGVPRGTAILGVGNGMNGIIGGYVGGAGSKKAPLNPVFAPDRITIERLIELLSEADGLVVLRVVPVSTLAPCELSLYAEQGMFVLVLNTTLGDDNAIVDILSMHGLDFNFVGMPGNAYPRRAVTRDFAVVRRVFRAISELGTLSADSIMHGNHAR